MRAIFFKQIRQEENNLHDFNSVSKIGLFCFFVFVLLFCRPIGLVVFFRKIKIMLMLFFN